MIQDPLAFVVVATSAMAFFFTVWSVVNAGPDLNKQTRAFALGILGIVIPPVLLVVCRFVLFVSKLIFHH